MKKPNKFYARVKRGAPTIFTVLSVAGVIATGILSARAANKTRNTEESEKSTVNNFKEGWKNYIPAIAVGGVTIVCSISSNVLNRHQRVALVSAYTLASKSYEDYKRKTKELYGEEAHQKIMESLAAEKAEDVYISTADFAGSSSLAWDDRSVEEKRTFYDSYSRRYFESTVCQVLEAEYHLNRNRCLGMDVTVNDFYEFLGIKPIKGGDKIGWWWSDEIYWIDFIHHRTERLDTKPVFTAIQIGTRIFLIQRLLIMIIGLHHIRTRTMVQFKKD